MAALRRALKREGDPELFKPTIRSEKTLRSLPLRSWNFTLLAHLRLSLDVFAGNLNATSEAKTTASDAVALLTETLTRNDPEYWRTTALDLDLICGMRPLLTSMSIGYADATCPDIESPAPKLTPSRPGTAHPRASWSAVPAREALLGGWEGPLPA